ncbi:hypothetical protein GCM10010429_41740 [Micromonospora olivasterospora]|uniref:Uncharacterized protein n=1 Tax=Micromonospora olivasterospora TaxID=1880 RepID=A0A562I9H4_MICOL|nr:hypothetical protein JD77_02308 [Micromonospora olivasterospora]
MFGIGRRKTRGQLARAELNLGIGHLRQAATYAAKGAGATVGPRVQAARSVVAPTAVMVRDRASNGLASTAAALAPLALAVRNAQAEAAGRATAGRRAAAAKQAAVTRKAKARNLKAGKRKSRRGGRMMTGLFAAGAVAGLAGAMAMRRRRERQEWTEYDPTVAIEPARDEVDTLVVQTPSANGDRPGAPTGSSGSPAASGPAGGSAAASGPDGGARPAGAGSSAVAGGDGASTTKPGGKPTARPTDKVPSVAEGARDASGRPADDLGKALGKQDQTRSGGRR